jgi:hypothetical protein
LIILLFEAIDPINWIPAARAGVKVLSKVAPALNPIKSRFASVSVEATSTAYAQSKLMVANKGFMSEQEKFLNSPFFCYYYLR